MTPRIRHGEFPHALPVGLKQPALAFDDGPRPSTTRALLRAREEARADRLLPAWPRPCPASCGRPHSV